MAILLIAFVSSGHGLSTNLAVFPALLYVGNFCNPNFSSGFVGSLNNRDDRVHNNLFCTPFRPPRTTSFFRKSISASGHG